MKYFVIFLVLVGLFTSSAFAFEPSWTNYYSNPEFKIYKVQENAYEFSIPYKISNAELDKINIDCDSTALIIYLDKANAESNLIINIPRALLDMKINDKDDDFIIILDQLETDYQEIDTDSNSRTFDIPLQTDGKILEIIASSMGMFPEPIPCGVGSDDESPYYQLLSPLKQAQSDIPFDEIQCKQNLVLLQKYDGSSACVTESTKTKLVERGWTGQKSQDMKTTLTPYCTNPLYVLDPDTNTCITNKTLPKCTDNTASDTVIQHCRVSVTCDKEFDPDTMGSDVSLLPQCTPLRDCPDGFQFGIFPVNGDDALCEREDRKIHAGVYYPYEKQMLATSGIDHNQNDIHSKPINLNGTKEQRTIQISVITSGWYEKLGHPTVMIESNGNQIEQLVMDLKKTEPGQTIHGIEYVLSEDLPDGTITIRTNMPEYDLLPSQSFDVKHISE